MNLDLEQRLQAADVEVARLSKAAKVKTLARWSKAFPELMASARRGIASPEVMMDKDADHELSHLHRQEYFVLPDDPSGMPSCLCRGTIPDLTELVSDTVTKCDELVLVEVDFAWAAVLSNHGSPQLVGRHFQLRQVRTQW